MKEKGSISIHTENIFPIIKKFLYSDHEIFLRELVSNAVDATQKIKRLSSLGQYKGELGDLLVEVAVDKDKKTITVSDQGPGFPGSITPFAPCRSEKIGGSGIGLALCKQLANHLGAELELSSNTPKGCRFSLRLAASVCNPILPTEAERLPTAR